MLFSSERSHQRHLQTLNLREGKIPELELGSKLLPSERNPINRAMNLDFGRGKNPCSRVDSERG